MYWLLQVVLLVTTVVAVSGNSDKDAFTEEHRLHELGLNILRYQLSHDKRDLKGLVMGEFRFITGDGISHFIVYALYSNGDFKILGTKHFNVDVERLAANVRQPSETGNQGQTFQQGNVGNPGQLSKPIQSNFQTYQGQIGRPTGSGYQQPGQLELVRYQGPMVNFDQAGGPGKNNIHIQQAYPTQFTKLEPSGFKKQPSDSEQQGPPRSNNFNQINYSRPPNANDQSGFPGQSNNFQNGRYIPPTTLEQIGYPVQPGSLEQSGYSRLPEKFGQTRNSEDPLRGLLSGYLGKFENLEKVANQGAPTSPESQASRGYPESKQSYQHSRPGNSQNIEPAEYQRLRRRLEGTRYPGQTIQQGQYGKPEYGSYTGQTVRQHSLDYSREPQYSLGYAGGRRQQEYQGGLKREKIPLGYPGEQTGPGYYDVRGNFGNTEQPKERRYSGQSSYQIPIEYSKEKSSEQIGVSGQNKPVSLEDLLQEEIRQGQLSILKKRQNSGVSGGSQTHTSSKNSGTLSASGSIENSR